MSHCNLLRINWLIVQVLCLHSQKMHWNFVWKAVFICQHSKSRNLVKFTCRISLTTILKLTWDFLQTFWIIWIFECFFQIEKQNNKWLKPSTNTVFNWWCFRNFHWKFQNLHTVFVTCLQLKICSITFKEILQIEAKEKVVRIKIDSLVLLFDKLKEPFWDKKKNRYWN